MILLAILTYTYYIIRQILQEEVKNISLMSIIVYFR